MRKEDRSELIQDALDMLDDDMIEEVGRLRARQIKAISEAVDVDENTEMVINRVKKFPWRRWTALAASICLLFIGSWAWENYVGPAPKENSAHEESLTGTEDFPNIENITEGEEETVSQMDTVEPLGDKYGLQDNYISISILPHKIWENAGSDEEAIKQAVVIEEEYKAEFNKLVKNVCTTQYCYEEELMLSDTDMIYHLFFEKANGEVVHCWLLGEGYFYYNDLTGICIVLDESVYAMMVKILAMH